MATLPNFAQLGGRGVKVGGKAVRRGAQSWPALKAAQAFASTRRRGSHSKAAIAAAAVAGAAGEYFLDPADGKRRRHVVRDKALKVLRRGGRRAGQAARHGAGVASGTAQATKSSDRPPAHERLNDSALARKVETEIFRSEDAPKGSVNVNVEQGVVYLRGEADPDQIGELAAKAGKVDGVREVENLLHSPGSDAPSKDDGRAGGRTSSR